jgi:hypothetical protein
MATAWVVADNHIYIWSSFLQIKPLLLTVSK